VDDEILSVIAIRVNIMKVGISLPITVKNPQYLRAGAKDVTGQIQSENQSIAALFRHGCSSPSLKMMAVTAEGKGDVRKLSIVVDVYDNAALLKEASEAFLMSGGDCEITDAFQAVYELAVASNNNDSPDQLGISIGYPVELSDLEIQGLLGKKHKPCEQEPGL
jgi:hypothetical protein